ncbi:MAG: heme-copper oxidase subunit III [Acidimicrobiia bacterium]|nr:heme-copper oxidase subunit III [Acidimicrobiia bacterium]
MQQLAVRGHEAEQTGTGVGNTKLGMWLFLSSDFLFFGGFIAAFLLYRGREGQAEPLLEDVLDIPFTSVTSFILLMSSLTMVLSLAAIQRGDHRRLRVWLMATVLFGLTFISGQVYEFTEFYREGFKLGTNLSASSFFVLTGLHGAHVTAGIVWLMSLWGMSVQGRLTSADAEKVEVAGLYWHFVDVIWIVIFTVVYLVPQ